MEVKERKKSLPFLSNLSSPPQINKTPNPILKNYFQLKNNNQIIFIDACMEIKELINDKMLKDIGIKKLKYKSESIKHFFYLAKGS